MTPARARIEAAGRAFASRRAKGPPAGPDPALVAAAQRALRDDLPPARIRNNGSITIRAIQQAVAERTGVRVVDLIGRRRKFARQRQITMYIARECTLHSTPVIGDHFDGRDHTTVLHACRVIEALAYDPAVACIIADVRQVIAGRVETREVPP